MGMLDAVYNLPFAVISEPLNTTPRIRFSSMWKSTVSSTNLSMTVHVFGIESTFSSVAIGTLLFSILNPVNIVSMKINRRSSEK